MHEPGNRWIIVTDHHVHPKAEGAIQDLAATLDLDVRALVPTASLQEDLGLDSLQFVTCLAWLEERGIIVSDPIRDIKTVGSIIDLLVARGNLGSAARLVLGGSPAVISAADPRASSAKARSDPLAPVLANNSYRLRELRQEDLPFLYSLASEPETGYRWRYRGVVPSLEKFASELWSGVLQQMVVVDLSSGDVVGLVVCYQADLGNGHAFLGAVFSTAATRSGVPVTAVELFVRHIFRVHPVRKIYLEVPEWNLDQIASGVGLYFVQEGCLKRHNYYGGKYWDEYIFALYRSDGEPA